MPDTATSLPKQYRPDEHEPRIWDRWLSARAFEADPSRVLSGEARPYCILMPPPNVTAALHLGHALNGTIQDILIRAHRMMGYEALWMPGADHAGIATQTVVDKRLQSEGKPALADYKKKELAGENGREQFIDLVLAWKDEYAAIIKRQFEAMGCGADWRRYRFTMDDVCARAVREAFFRLFRDGLIYRGKRLVNWDPVTQTALADDEVENQEIDGAFYYLRYPLVHKTGSGDHSPVTWGELATRGYPGGEQHPGDEQAWVTVATTRPETYLGDTGVAVNPRDPRATAVRGLMCELPIVGRVIPIVEDDYVVLPVQFGGEKGDPKAEMSTGFLKVTPAHDPNDEQIGKRHDLRVINVMAPDASISDQHGWEDVGDAGKFIGLSREDARTLVIEEFRARSVAEGVEGSLLEKIVPHRHSVGHSYRSHVPIEPYLSDQWYCRVTDDKLRGSAQRALTPSQRTKASLESWPESSPSMNEPRLPGSGFTMNANAPLPHGRGSSGDGELTFYPERYAKTYETWHDNLRDWCISRQLWWGHRIPVWSRTTGFGGFPEVTMISIREHAKNQTTYSFPAEPKYKYNGTDTVVRYEINEAEQTVITRVCVAPGNASYERYLERSGYTQDPDVLDTWFSSALWPHSTMGWPNPDTASSLGAPGDTIDLLQAFNTTSVLTTAREIITLWVSRMVMFNRYFLGQDERSAIRAATVRERSGSPDPSTAPSRSRLIDGRLPFHDVFIHAMIQDGEGRKMSKTLGNGVDPFDIIATHGADAMRFTLAKMTTQTQDVRMPVVKDEKTGKNTSPKFDEGRNFCNKLWNAARFTLAMLDKSPPDAGRAFTPSELSLADRWMLSRLESAVGEVNEAIACYQFSAYAQSMYDLLWRDFCDWYLEAIKPQVADDPGTRATLRVALETILRLLHPITPFVSEAIHERLRDVPLPTIEGVGFASTKSDETLCQSGWPEIRASVRDEGAETEFEWVRSLVRSINETRAAHKVEPRRKVTLHAPSELESRLGGVSDLVRTLGGLEAIMTDASSEGAVFTFESSEWRLSNLADAVDAGAERERLTKQREDLTKRIGGMQGRLSNPGYVDKAPAHLVQQTRDELASLQEELAAVKKALEGLG